MRQLIVSLVAIVLPTLCLSDSINEVYVEGSQVGQGFIVERLGQCYFISPHHVVSDDPFLNLRGSDEFKSLGEGIPVQTFGYDLAVGYVSGALANRCETSFSQIQVSSSSIENARKAVINTVNSDGLLSRTDVLVKEAGLVYLTVVPTDPNQDIYQGMSGGVVFTETEAIGMLQSFDQATGEGHVLRMDRLVETVSPLLASTRVPVYQKTETSVPLAMTIPYTISSWNLPTSSIEHPISFLNDNNGSTFYLAQLGNDVLEIELSLTGVSEIAVATLVFPEGHNVRDVEILTSRRSSGRRGWMVAESGSLMPDERELNVDVRRAAQRLKIRVTSSWEPADSVRISEVKLF